jgi:hypothetical protein
MVPQADLPSIIASAAVPRGLRPRQDLREPNWSFWELRNLNIHRVVGLFDERRPIADARDLEAEIRGVVSRRFKRSWWRGMAYGVVAVVGAVSLSPDDLKTLVDVRENQSGTLQWVILTSSDTRVALGVHTWIEGRLSPVYRDILQALDETKYHVTSTKRDKDGLMKFLTGVADVNVAIRSLGTRRTAFPEFREPSLGENQTRLGSPDD